MLEFNYLRIRSQLGWGFCLCHSAGVMEMITHLSITALQTGKSEYKRVDGSVQMILWILSMPDKSQSQGINAHLSQTPLELWLGSTQAVLPYAQIPMEQGLVKAGTQLPAEAHLMIRLLDNVWCSQHPTTKIRKKHLSEVKAFHSGKALERQFISSLFSPT